MSLSRPMNLPAWAGHADVWILEDDYDSEYRAGLLFSFADGNQEELLLGVKRPAAVLKRL
jgi:hypothetical protein